MKRFVTMMALAVAFVGSVATASYGDTVLQGTTDGGAFFKIVVPTAWNGDLVIWNHGFSFDPVGPVADLGPLSALQLSEGYAVAASSYQQSEWALFHTKNDLQNMMAVFKTNFGTPNHILLNGASLGGIVTDQADEKANLGNVVGAYPLCGVHAGSINWNGSLDLRLLYDYVCSNTPAAAIPGGTTGLPAPGFPGYPFTDLQVALAVNACTGILLPSPTAQQSENLSQLLELTDLPASFLIPDMVFATKGMSNLIFDPAKLDGGQGVGNANVNYDDGGPVDEGITRVAASPGAANRLTNNYVASGDVGNTKIVSLHTDKDGLVLVENENFYASVVPASNLTTAIAVEPAPTHCGFTAAETVAGWESLRGWVAGGPQPTATSIENLCLFISGGDATQCRIDPSFVIPPLSNRIRPR
jgi:hypothetical protein